MNHLYSGNNGWAQTYALFIDRADERKLRGQDRLGNALLLASDVEQIKAVALATSGLSDEEIEDRGLRNPELDVRQLGPELTEATGDDYEIVLYETDALIVDRLFGR